MNLKLQKKRKKKSLGGREHPCLYRFSSIWKITCVFRDQSMPPTDSKPKPYSLFIRGHIILTRCINTKQASHLIYRLSFLYILFFFFGCSFFWLLCVLSIPFPPIHFSNVSDFWLMIVLPSHKLNYKKQSFWKGTTLNRWSSF